MACSSEPIPPSMTVGSPRAHRASSSRYAGDSRLMAAPAPRGLRLAPRLSSTDQVTELGMTPEAVHGGVMLDLPGGVVDGAGTPPVLQGEAGGIGQVEGHHVVVHVPPQVDRDGNAV